MKKFLSVLMAMLMVVSLLPAIHAEGEEKLNPKDYPKCSELKLNLTVDGKPFTAAFANVTRYFSEEGEEWTQDYGYIRLRDLAAALNGTEAQFGIDFNKETKELTLTAGQGYEPLPTDLQKREVPTVFEENTALFTINGKKLEKPMDAIIINREYYVQIGAIRRALGKIYTNILTKEALDISAHKTDIKEIGLAELKEKFAKHENSILFVWAPWCGWCKREAGRLQEFLEYAKDKDARVISVVADYADTDMAHLPKLFKMNAVPENWEIYGINKETADWVKTLNADGELYFPQIYFMDKEAKPILQFDNTYPTQDDTWSWVYIYEKVKEGKAQEIIDAYKAAAEKAAEEKK